jgi:hypothetical protein
MPPAAVIEPADVLNVPAVCTGGGRCHAACGCRQDCQHVECPGGAQGMKGGAPAAEVAFTAAQLAAGTAPQLHTAFVSALARCRELSQVQCPSSCLLVLVTRSADVCPALSIIASRQVL